jgi:hypothetical protein
MYNARLDILGSKSQRLLEKRQSTLVAQRRSLTLPVSDPDIPTYLYQSKTIDGSYPALNMIADCAQLLESLHIDLRKELQTH